MTLTNKCKITYKMNCKQNKDCCSYALDQLSRGCYMPITASNQGYILYIYIYICVCVCVCVRVCVCIYVSMYVCMLYVCIYAHIHVYAYVCKHISKCKLSVCTYVKITCVCMYACT